MQQKEQWMKTFRDVYLKFIKSKVRQQSTILHSDQTSMPFFYLRNNNFAALFIRDSNGLPIAVLNPNKSLAQIINECRKTHKLLIILQNQFRRSSKISVMMSKKRKMKGNAKRNLTGTYQTLRDKRGVQVQMKIQKNCQLTSHKIKGHLT